ncbi:MAG: hypothetical protein OXH56_10245 [Gemmatimonadetes bacterium]|nr:hypothetical protein [Gemmatimonadota bacterium]
MKRPFNRIMTSALACFLIAGWAVAGCGGEDGGDSQDHGAEPAEIEAPDPNTEARQEHMREIARLCEGIAAAVENGALGTIGADVSSLKEIMEEVSTMPPRYDSSRYGFYASDFQIRAETLIAAAETGSAIEADSALQDLNITCGVCHYNCQYPADP